MKQISKILFIAKIKVNFLNSSCECHLIFENVIQEILQPLQVLANIWNFILIVGHHWQPYNAGILSHLI